MSISALDKELVAIAVSIAAGCRPCTTYHVAAARKAGAADPAIQTAVASAVCVRTSATEGMRRQALELGPPPDGCGCSAKNVWEELAALGASLAVNCTQNIDKHLVAARALGVTQGDMDEVFALVETIRARAIGHVKVRFAGSSADAAALNDRCASASASCC
ncbi:MAG: carboxymuconolactone decarboxylase family protein [Beijerinckiaceae bacterium]